MWVQVAADVAILLDRFARKRSFAETSGGGGQGSNMRLLCALLPLGLQRARSCSAAALQVRPCLRSGIQWQGSSFKGFGGQ